MSLCTEITPRQDVCIICNTETNDGSKIVQLTEKGSIGMNKANKERGDDIVTKSGHTVHEKCLLPLISNSSFLSLHICSTVF
jgi:hypothetical protein